MNNITVEVLDGLYYLGVNDRETPRFENLWPLEYGVAYNAYLIVDEKVALLDTVKITKVDGFKSNFIDKIADRNLDYIVIHHVEPDHAGAVSTLMDKYPDVTVVGNKQTRRLLSVLYGIDPKNFLEVKDGDVLDLGKRKLRFYMTPMVHWPESMVSYDEGDKVLFSQDIFGAFGTVDGSIFDDEMDYKRIKSEIRRYFSNVIGKHSAQTEKILKKIENLDIKMICPVHGPVWRTNIERIMEAYKSWASHEVEPGVVLVYGSMYGTTEGIADNLARFLVENGVNTVKVFDASKSHPSYIINQIFKYNGLIIGSTTYNTKMLPSVQNLVSILEHYKFKNHIFGFFAEYGWGSATLKELKEFAYSSKFELVETQDININGCAKEEDLEKLRKLAKEMADKVLRR